MNSRDLSDYLRDLDRRDTRRFLSEPEPVTGFDVELLPLVRSRLEVGRQNLVQIGDFYLTERAGEAVRRPTFGDRA